MNLIKKHQNQINFFGLELHDIDKLLHHCLQNNYLRFGQQFYRQKTGIAMGSRIAPPIAIVFMNAVESLFLASLHHQPLIYLRYIDDILGIWSHGSELLDSFYKSINSFHPSLKFSIERTDQSESNSIAFLDTTLTIHPNGKYCTELYIKPMAAPIILPYNSAHSIQTKKSILYSQLLRAKRVGSDKEAQKRGLLKIENIFKMNGYPNNLIQRTKTRIIRENIPKLTRPKTEERTYIRLPFIDDELSHKVSHAVKTSKLPFQITWLSGKTLSNKITRSALDPPPCPAGNRRCFCCMAGLEGGCHQRNSVYQITCQLCSKIYIGESKRMIRERYMEHLRDARNKTKNTRFGEDFKTSIPKLLI